MIVPLMLTLDQTSDGPEHLARNVTRPIQLYATKGRCFEERTHRSDPQDKIQKRRSSSQATPDE